jgi:hypothetical protein
MRLFSIDAFIGLAIRAEPIFNVFHKPISQPGLLIPSVFAYGAGDTMVGHFSIFFRDTHSPSPVHVLKVRIYNRIRTFEEEIPILIEKVKKNY